MKFALLKNTNSLVSFEYRLVKFTFLQLLQRNVQLGAATKFSLLSSHWFIFGTRQKFAIINLSQTIIHLRGFLEVIRYVSSGRRRVLFVNERRYARSIASEIAASVGEAYVTGRWVGGSLTNFRRIWIMYNRTLKFKYDKYLSRFKLNLKNSLRGLSSLCSLPAVVFFNSIRGSFWASEEAHALLIPSGGITDSDAFPSSALYPIPGNDDAFGSVYFLNKLVAKVILISKMSVMLKLYSKFCDSLTVQIEKMKRRAARLKKLKKYKTKKNFHGKKNFFKNKANYSFVKKS